MPFAMQKSEKYFSRKILNAKAPVRLLKLEQKSSAEKRTAYKSTSSEETAIEWKTNKKGEIP